MSKVTLWQTMPSKQGTPERTPAFKMQYQPQAGQATQSSARLSWLERLKKAFTLREDHVRWMENAQSGLGLPASMSHSLLEKSGRGKNRS